MARRELDRLLRLLEDEGERRFALAEINGLLHRLTPTRLQEAVEGVTVSHLPTLVQNYLAAMVEQAAQMKAVRPPEWTRDVMPLEEPHFAGGLRNFRPHLLRASPVAFKRRNIFVDSSIGDRV